MLYHDSRKLHYRKPFGASKCESTVIIKATPKDEINDVKLTTFFGTSSQEYTMEYDGTDYVVKINLPSEPGLLFYRFREISNSGEQIYGKMGEVEGYCIPTDNDGCCYQITVYKDTPTPTWMRDGIMYQIFVDRFYNGNDGVILSPRDHILVHTSWDDKPLYARDETYAILEWDFFGGNLMGVIKKLDYIKSLGATIVYLNPIFDSVSNHKYDASDYSKIDKMFGDDEIFAKLIFEANKRDMHIVLDGVFSHTGSDSIYFNREGNCNSIGAYQGEDSPYYSWYNFEEFPNKYDCWWGVGTMPCLIEMDPSFLKYLVTGENSIVRKWMRMGIMGWRLDVADELPDEFIEILKSVIKEENPEAMLLGEVWEDASNKESYGNKRRYFYGDELDSVSNYPFRDSMTEYLLGNMTNNQLVTYMHTLMENYPKAYFYSLMNMTGTHDTIRLMNLLGEADHPKGKTQKFLREYVLPDDKKELAIKRIKLYYLIMMSHPGMPCIYYGDETAMEGFADPFNRGTYPWGNENKELIDFVSMLAKMRHNNKVFTEGDYLPLIGGKNGYTSKRELNNQSVYTLINPKSEEETFVITLNNNVKGLLDMHTGTQIFADRNREAIIKLSPLSGTWLQEIV